MSRNETAAEVIKRYSTSVRLNFTKVHARKWGSHKGSGICSLMTWFNLIHKITSHVMLYIPKVCLTCNLVHIKASTKHLQVSQLLVFNVAKYCNKPQSVNFAEIRQLLKVSGIGKDIIFNYPYLICFFEIFLKVFNSLLWGGHRITVQMYLHVGRPEFEHRMWVKVHSCKGARTLSLGKYFRFGSGFIHGKSVSVVVQTV